MILFFCCVGGFFFCIPQFFCQHLGGATLSIFAKRLLFVCGLLPRLRIFDH
jgi:hypothetical protein